MKSNPLNFKGYSLVLLVGALVVSSHKQYSAERHPAGVTNRHAAITRPTTADDSDLRFLHIRGIACNSRSTPSVTAYEVSDAQQTAGCRSR